MHHESFRELFIGLRYDRENIAVKLCDAGYRVIVMSQSQYESRAHEGISE